MKLASLRAGRDGRLVVVSRDGTRFAEARAATTLQMALDDWKTIEPALRRESEGLAGGGGKPLDSEQLTAPLPRAFEWVDG